MAKLDKEGPWMYSGRYVGCGPPGLRTADATGRRCRVATAKTYVNPGRTVRHKQPRIEMHRRVSL